MFSSLRRRLLLSYGAIIALVLVMVALFLIVFISLSQRTRIQPTVEHLMRISMGTQRELRQQSVRGNVPSEELEALLTEISEDFQARIFVLDAQSTVLFDSSDSLADQTLDYSLIPARQIPSGVRVPDNAHLISIQGPGGTDWIGLLRGGRDSNARAIIFAVPETTAVTTFRNVFFTPLFWTGCVASLLAILLAFVISRSVAGPLKKMAIAAEAIAEGDYNQQLGLKGPSEVKRLASSFNRMARQVKHTQQSQRDFVANVSHDLKTPLTSIQGWSQAFLDGTVQTAEQQARAAQIIHLESERMTRMVNQLLDLAKLESGQLNMAQTRVDLRALLEDVTHSLALAAEEKGVALTLEDNAPERPLTLVGDPDRLIQIFANLMGNAIEHTPDGGEVSLSMRPLGKSILVTVTDTGKGIPPEDLPRIFERFYQVDKSRSGQKGTGLGLSIVQQLTEAHGGSISAKSTVGKGSTFTVRLPVNGRRLNGQAAH